MSPDSMPPDGISPDGLNAGVLLDGASWDRLSLLVLSPTPTFPVNQGNRRRIHRVCTRLRELGATITFIHYPAEDDWRRGLPVAAQQQMQAEWDGYFLVPPTRPLHPDPAHGPDHSLDEWWDPAIGDFLSWIFRLQRFDAFIVNYTWLSKALDFAPPGTLKILDTHDRFSGRRSVLEKHGIKPEFYHIDADDERRALQRADVVWAIKHQEAEYFSSLWKGRIFTLAHCEPIVFGPRPRGELLRFGIFGAANKVNVTNIVAFMKVAEAFIIDTLLPCQFVLGGSCCDLLPPMPPFVTRLGRVAKVEDFYRAVDVVLAPMSFSTGLKIRVGEALSFSKAIIAHAHAYEGYPPEHKFHLLSSFEEMMQACNEVVRRPEMVLELEQASLRAVHRSDTEVEETLQHTVEVLWRIEAGVCIVFTLGLAGGDSFLLDNVREMARYAGHQSKVTIFLDAATDPAFTEDIARGLLALGSLILSPRLAATPSGKVLKQRWVGAVHVRPLAQVVTDGHFLFWFAGFTPDLDAVHARSSATAYVSADAFGLQGAQDRLPRFLAKTAEVFAEAVVANRRVSDVTCGLASSGFRVLCIPMIWKESNSETLRAGRLPETADVVVLTDSADDPIATAVMGIVQARSTFRVQIVTALHEQNGVAHRHRGNGAAAEESISVYLRRFERDWGPPALVIDLAATSTIDGVREFFHRASVPVIRLRGIRVNPRSNYYDPLRPASVLELCQRVSTMMTDHEARRDLIQHRDVRSSGLNDAGWAVLWTDIGQRKHRALH